MIPLSPILFQNNLRPQQVNRCKKSNSTRIEINIFNIIQNFQNHKPNDIIDEYYSNKLLKNITI